MDARVEKMCAAEENRGLSKGFAGFCPPVPKDYSIPEKNQALTSLLSVFAKIGESSFLLIQLTWISIFFLISPGGVTGAVPTFSSRQQGTPVLPF